MKKIEEDSRKSRNAEEEFATFQPKINRKNYDSVRTKNQFLQDISNWTQKKNENIKKNQYKFLSEELKDLTFTPHISNNSNKISSKVNE